SHDRGPARRAGHRRRLPVQPFHCLLLAPRVKISYQAVTDVGRKRKGNEDSLFVNADQNLFVVADGMGGHAAGEVASKVAVESINEFVCLTGDDEEITWPFGLDENMSYDANR